MKGIIIFGSAGAGKTSLGRLVAEKTGFSFLDIDDFIWRTDTAVPYTVMYSKEEKIKRLMWAAQKTGEFIMAGSMNSFHKHFDPFFTLAVYLTADEKTRLERVHDREAAAYGERIQPGGDMYEIHQVFCRDVAGYDHGGGSCNREQHEEWIRQLTCPVLRLDGGELLESNAAKIIDAYQKAI